MGVTLALAGIGSASAEPMQFDHETGEVVVGGEVEPLSSGEREATGDLGDAMGLFGAKVDDPAIQSALAASNTRTSRMTDQELVALDVKWKEEAAGGAMSRSVTQVECSQVLRDFGMVFRQFGQMLVADAKGVVVCATEKPESYFFGNESWFRQTMKAAEGETEASGQVAERPPPGAPTMPLYAPVVDPDSGKTLGVGRAIFKTGL